MQPKARTVPRIQYLEQRCLASQADMVYTHEFNMSWQPTPLSSSAAASAVAPWSPMSVQERASRPRLSLRHAARRESSSQRFGVLVAIRSVGE